MPLIIVLACLALTAMAQPDSQLHALVRLVDQLQRQFDESKLELERLRAELQQDILQLKADQQEETQNLREHLKRVESGCCSDRVILTGADLELRVTHVEGSVSILEQQMIVMDSKIVLNQAEISKLDNEVNDVEDDVEKLENRVDEIKPDDSVDARLGAIESQVNAQKKTDTDHSQLITQLHTGFEELEASTDTRLDSHSKQMEHIDTGLRHLQADTKDMQSRLQEVESKEEERYSFLADLTSDHRGSDVIVFDRVRHNRGGVYDSRTGVWKAPKNGVYQFTVNLNVIDHLHAAALELYVDSVLTTRSLSLITDSDNGYVMTQTVQLQLGVGQLVAVKLLHAIAVDGNAEGTLYSYFTGHLVQNA